MDTLTLRFNRNMKHNGFKQNQIENFLCGFDVNDWMTLKIFSLRLFLCLVSLIFTAEMFSNEFNNNLMILERVFWNKVECETP